MGSGRLGHSLARALGQSALVPDPGLHLAEVERLLAEVASLAALRALLATPAGPELEADLLPDFGLEAKLIELGWAVSS